MQELLRHQRGAPLRCVPTSLLAIHTLLCMQTSSLTLLLPAFPGSDKDLFFPLTNRKAEGSIVENKSLFAEAAASSKKGTIALCAANNLVFIAHSPLGGLKVRVSFFLKHHTL